MSPSTWDPSASSRYVRASSQLGRWIFDRLSESRWHHLNGCLPPIPCLERVFGAVVHTENNMHYPLVGERVWVSGCCDEFTVVRTDYTAFFATIYPSADTGARRRNLPFLLLFAHEDYKAAQDGVATISGVRDVLHSSRQSLIQSELYLRELREIIRATIATIQQSQILIARSDSLIARAETLDHGRRHLSREDHKARDDHDGSSGSSS